MFTSQLVLVTDHFNLHVYGVSNEIQFMCICNHLHVICHQYHSDLSQYTCRFAVIFMCIYLSLVSFRIVMIFLWIFYNLCVYLSQVSFIFVPLFICICEEMQIYMIQICHNIHVFLSKAAY